MIYYDEFETWQGSFCDLVVGLLGEEEVINLASSDLECVEDAGNVVVTQLGIKTVSTEIRDWLSAREFCVFHGTRLLPEEILSVEQKGLLPLVASDREQRLRKILERHPKWDSVQDGLLKVLEDVGPKEQQGRRQGQVHFSLSRSGLVNDFNHYLTHGSEFDQHVVKRLFHDQSGLDLLNSETVPVLIHASISGEELIMGAHPYFSYSEVMDWGQVPGLARTFLNTWSFKTAKQSFDIAELQTDCCLTQWAETPPERILKIEKLSDFTAN